MKRKMILLDLLKQAFVMEQRFVAALSTEERTRAGTLEAWTAKDIIAHIAAWRAKMAANLLAVSEGRSPTRTEDIDHENALLFEKYHAHTWDEVLEMAAQAHHKIVEQVERLTETELISQEVLPWQEAPPLWRLIIGTAYLHPVGHLAEYYRNRDDREQAGELLGEMTRAMAKLDAGPHWQGVVKYNLACQYSLLGAPAQAIDALREALSLNPDLLEWSQQDPDLEAIREEPEYQALYEN